MSTGQGAKPAEVMTSTGRRAFEEKDIPKVSGFILLGLGIGDILSMLPMVDRAVELLGKRLFVFTRRPEVFRYHPNVEVFFPDPQLIQNHLDEGNLLFISPVCGPGDRFEKHLIEQSAEGIVDIPITAKRIRFPSDESCLRSVQEKLTALNGKRPLVIVHPAQSMPVRSWPIENWVELVRELLLDYEVISIGHETSGISSQGELLSKTPYTLNIKDVNFHDWTGKLSLHESYELIRLSDLVITVDSGTLHLANCTQTPIVSIFTHVAPEFRMRFGPDGKIGYKTIPVFSPCESQFCASRFGCYNDRCLLEGKDSFMQCLPSTRDVLRATRQSLQTKNSA